VEEIIQHLSDNISNALQKIKASPACLEKGQQYREFIQLLLERHNSFGDLEEWNQFKYVIHCAITKGLGNSRFLLPSSLTTILQKNVENLLSDVNERRHLSDLFKVFADFSDEEMVQFLLADYVLFLVTYIIQFVSLCVRKSIPAPLVIPTGMEISDNDYLETIYYVAGAKVRAFYKKSKKFPKHSGWKNIGRVINERLLESDSVPGPPAHVKGWTAAQSRGRLFFVSGLLFDFFCGVVVLLEKQGSKKRVDFDDVIQKVCESGVILLWDEAVGDSMSQEESFKFMSAMVQAFCQTFTVGKAQRLINSMRKKAEASIPLRHKVVPKPPKENPPTSK